MFCYLFEWQVPPYKYFMNAENAVNVWYNSKEQRIYQHKKGKVRAAQVAKPKHACFDVNELSPLSSSSSSSDSEDD